MPEHWQTHYLTDKNAMEHYTRKSIFILWNQEILRNQSCTANNESSRLRIIDGSHCSGMVWLLLFWSYTISEYVLARSKEAVVWSTWGITFGTIAVSHLQPASPSCHKSHVLNMHGSADGTHIYLSLTRPDDPAYIGDHWCRVEEYLSQIHKWMPTNKLKLNSSKTSTEGTLAQYESTSLIKQPNNYFNHWLPLVWTFVISSCVV